MNHKYLLAGVAAAALLTAGNAYAAAHASMEDQLKAQAAAIDALSKEVEALKNSTPEQGIGQGVKAVNLTISGQVNRAVMFVSDANGETAFNYVDNDSSSTRVRWDADAAVSDSTEVGTRLEMEMESNTSIAAVRGEDAGGNTFVARHAYVYIKGGFGTLTTGQQGEATEGILHNSFNYATLADINPENTAGAANAGMAFLAFGDGGRQDAIRYDTPAFGGFKAAVSAGVDGVITVAGRYSGQIGGVGLLAGAGYDSNGEDDIYMASAGLNFGAIAVNGALAYQDNEVGEEDFMHYLGLAHKGNYSDMGPTSLGIDWMVNNGGEANGANNSSIGLGLVQGVAPGAEGYVSLRHFMGGDAEDSAQVVLAGMRVKF